MKPCVASVTQLSQFAFEPFERIETNLLMFAHFGLIVYARSRCDLCVAITSDRGSETANARTHTHTHTKRHSPNTLARATKGAHKSTTRRRYVSRPLEIEHGATHTQPKELTWHPSGGGL